MATSNDSNDIGNDAPNRPDISARSSSFQKALTVASDVLSQNRSTINLSESASASNSQASSHLPVPTKLFHSHSFLNRSDTSAKKPESSENIPRAPHARPRLTVDTVKAQALYPANRHQAVRITTPKPSDNRTLIPRAPTSRPRLTVDTVKAQALYPANRHQAVRITTAPVTTPKRDSSAQIKHHGLMQPIHPPMPRSSTLGNLAAQTSSPLTPSFMRSTSSSAARSASNRVSHMQQQSKETPDTIASTTGQRLRPPPRESGYRISTPTNPNLVPNVGVDRRTGIINPFLAKAQGEVQHTARSTSLASFKAVNQSDSAPIHHSGMEISKITDKKDEFLHPQRTKVDETPNFSLPLTSLKQKEQAISRHLEDLAIRGTFDDEDEDDYEEEEQYTPGAQDQRTFLPTAAYSQDTEQGELSSYPVALFHTHNLSISLPRTEINKEGSLVPYPSNPATEEHTSVANEAYEADSTNTTNPPITAVPYPHNPTDISTAQPLIYWAGRLTSLSDRYRTEALTSGTYANHAMDNDKLRFQRVFTKLRKLCVTQEARGSLEQFVVYWQGRNPGMLGIGAGGSLPSVRAAATLPPRTESAAAAAIVVAGEGGSRTESESQEETGTASETKEKKEKGKKSGIFRRAFGESAEGKKK